jgi:hypothetical protein
MIALQSELDVRLEELSRHKAEADSHRVLITEQMVRLSVCMSTAQPSPTGKDRAARGEDEAERLLLSFCHVGREAGAHAWFENVVQVIKPNGHVGYSGSRKSWQHSSTEV